MLKEQGIVSDLQLGFVRADVVPFPFCHSWIEIEGNLFDIGLYRPNPTLLSIAKEISSPIFNGINLETNEPTSINFGVKTKRVDKVHNQLSSSTLGEYMDGWPAHNDGLWGELVVIGEKLSITLDVNKLKEKYYSTPYKN